MKLFAEAGLEARIVQIADEKQSSSILYLLNLVSLVPKWTSRVAARGVRYVRLVASDMSCRWWPPGLAERAIQSATICLRSLQAHLSHYAREE